MANMAIKYEIAKHATANPSNVLSGGTYVQRRAYFRC